ncbi:sugar fermentation stimulation protein [Desulfolithobacter dissulfuricans]|uniref:Sugar fermentation stimulation protein homolog n=1 Tax=Desulfolithobacter dissulfuricans TaxID=2795293 RepID=A0A915U6M0_9BACT|nr:DNA/RNA nuclease SfsA [Desulfolithobacter dissulfuricans]BCO10342.1 sugar fermentation stimulation protein [Desulfolithobacter dissulfuricans]
MQLPKIRQSATLIKRYKRFLADVLLEDGSELTVHCPNSGSMRGCSTPGSPVIISDSGNPERKYRWTLEMVREKGVWIGVNTNLTNKLVYEALRTGVIDDFGQIHTIRPEVRVSDRSRLDFVLESDAGQVYIEVKNCSLVENGRALFPDAVTARGTKHLEELALLRKNGAQAAVLFCVQRADGAWFAPADEIDPLYADTLRKVSDQGVRILAYRAEVQPNQVTITEKIPCRIYPEEMPSR